MFNRYSFVINFLVKSLRLLPRGFVYWLYCMASSVPGSVGLGVRYVCVKILAKNVGDNVYIGRWVVLKSLEGLCIGSNVSFHEFCFIDALGGISISDNVSIANGVSLVSFEHTWKNDFVPIKYNPLELKSVSIDSDVWIGCGVRVLGGSQIGKRVVVAAGSVVRGNLKANGLYAGVPVSLRKEI